MPDIVLDNLIFDLQPHGGITSIWEAILRGVARDSSLNVGYLQAKHHGERLTALVGPDTQLAEDKGPILLRRFRKIRLPKGAKVFHSSYFRVAASPEVRNIVTVHDCIAEQIDRGPRRLLHLAQKKVALRNAHTVICVSHSTRRDLLRFYPWLDQEKVTVIHNGIDLDFFRPSDTARARGVLYVGGRGIHKNFELALRLIASPVARSMGLNLDVVGGGEPTEQERGLVSALKIGDKVRFHGAVGVQGLRDLYRRAFCLLYPSLYEGFGIPPVEAFACGCPVICSDQSSIPEVVEDAAIQFDPFKVEAAVRALEVVERDSEREALIAKGLARAQLFSGAVMAERTIDVYRGALEPRVSS